MKSRITFGPQRRNDAGGQTEVEVRFDWQVVGTLRRWHTEFLWGKHGWFFVCNHPLARAIFDFGFPPKKVTLADAKRAVILEARSHGLF